MGNEIKQSSGGFWGIVRGALFGVAKSGAASETWKIISPLVYGVLGSIGTTVLGIVTQAPALAIAVSASVVFAAMAFGAWKVQTFLEKRRTPVATGGPVASLKVEFKPGEPRGESDESEVGEAPMRAPDPPPTGEQDWDRWQQRDDGKLKIERDKGLPEALAYAITGLWGQEFMQAISQGIPEAGNVWQDFRQRAHDKKLTVWGKRTSHGIWVKIDPEFWVDHQPEWFDLLRGIARTEKTVNDARLDRYIDLMVSQTEFEKEWPHGLPAEK